MTCPGSPNWLMVCEDASSCQVRGSRTFSHSLPLACRRESGHPSPSAGRSSAEIHTVHLLKSDFSTRAPWTLGWAPSLSRGTVPCPGTLSSSPDCQQQPPHSDPGPRPFSHLPMGSPRDGSLYLESLLGLKASRGRRISWVRA